MSSQSDEKGLEQQEISEYFVDFSSALLAKRLAKNVWWRKKEKQAETKETLELPKCFQFLILCAAYLWSAVGGVFRNGVCVCF